MDDIVLHLDKFSRHTTFCFLLDKCRESEVRSHLAEPSSPIRILLPQRSLNDVSWALIGC